MRPCFDTKRGSAKAVEKDQELALRYAVLCNRKMQFLIRKIEFLTMYSGRKRLIQFLLSSSGPSGRVDSAGTREDMASMLGISRASLFRELAAFRRKADLSETGKDTGAEPGGNGRPDGQMTTGTVHKIRKNLKSGLTFFLTMIYNADSEIVNKLTISKMNCKPESPFIEGSLTQTQGKWRKWKWQRKPSR